MKPKPKKKTTILDPLRHDSNTWFYIEPKGLCAVREVRTETGHYIQTEQFVIPWRLIAKAQGILKATAKSQRRRRSAFIRNVPEPRPSQD